MLFVAAQLFLASGGCRLYCMFSLCIKRRVQPNETLSKIGEALHTAPQKQPEAV